jgi:hypothetical protein
MIIIKFVVRGSKITWFINENWIMVISFLLTMVASAVWRKRRIAKSAKKIKIAHPKGGGFIDECIEPDSIYELVDRPLEIVLKQMLDLHPEEGPIVISVPVLILSYIVSRQLIKQVTILGVRVVTDQAKTLAVKTGIGIVTGSVFLFVPLGALSIMSTLIGGALILSVAQGINHLECSDFVSKVTMEQVSQEKNIGFLETLPERSPKVFIKGNEDTELYIPSRNDNASCSSKYDPVEVKKSDGNPLKNKPQGPIQRTCKTQYVPLEKRTKTLADLKKDDSTENREEAAPYIKRYENRRKLILNKKDEL